MNNSNGQIGHNDAVLAHNWIEDDRTIAPRVNFFSRREYEILESVFPEVRLKQLDKKDY